MPKDDEQFSAHEAQRRFKDLVHRALNTKPKPLKSMTPKGMPSQSKKRHRKAKNKAKNAA